MIFAASIAVLIAGIGCVLTRELVNRFMIVTAAGAIGFVSWAAAPAEGLAVVAVVGWLGFLMFLGIRFLDLVRVVEARPAAEDGPPQPVTHVRPSPPPRKPGNDIDIDDLPRRV